MIDFYKTRVYPTKGLLAALCLVISIAAHATDENIHAVSDTICIDKFGKRDGQWTRFCLWMDMPVNSPGFEAACCRILGATQEIRTMKDYINSQLKAYDDVEPYDKEKFRNLNSKGYGADACMCYIMPKGDELGNIQMYNIRQINKKNGKSTSFELSLIYDKSKDKILMVDDVFVPKTATKIKAAFGDYFINMDVNDQRIMCSHTNSDNVNNNHIYNYSEHESDLTENFKQSIDLCALMAHSVLPSAIVKKNKTEEREYTKKEENKAKKQTKLFIGEDYKMHGGLSVGWVAKEWSTSANGRTVHEDIWGNPNKMLHGLQIGIHLQRNIFYGIGWRTGLYYEWYISEDNYVKEQGYSRFNEHGLYVPIHAILNMHITPKISICPYGGFGFNWAIYGNMKNNPDSQYYDSNLAGEIIGNAFNSWFNSGKRLFFDYNNHSPHHWNVQAEAGVALRIYKAELTFTYSWGLNRHWLYDDIPSHQNKMAANIAFTI